MMLRIKVLICIAGLVGITLPLWTATAQSQTCLPLLNDLTKPLIKQALKRGQRRVCAKVPRYTATHSVRLLGLRVCLEPEGISMNGAVEIICAGPPAPLLPDRVTEVLDFSGVFDISRCRLRGVQVMPRGILGKVMVNGLDIEGKLQSQLNRKLGMFCR